MMPSDAEIAWAAGLFEGEGCFFATNKLERKTGTRRTLHSAQLAMSDRDMVERFQAIVGVGGIIAIRDRRAARYRKMWRWQIQSRSGVEHVGELLRPWLGERRRAKLDEILAVLPLQHDPLTCDYELCGREFIPKRDRRGRKPAYCSRTCSVRAKAGVKAPRVKEYA